MILVTGAAGKTGRAVIRALAGRAQAVRALVRRKGQQETVRAAGAAAVVVADLQDRRAVARAAEGADAVYHIPPNMHPDEVAIGGLIIRAAHEAGVERFVYHSVLHPQTEAMPHHWNKLRVEESLFQSGLPFTILQPTAYMQNLLAGWEAIRGQGVYRVPYPVETRLSLVDLADVAEAAALVLTAPGHFGATYELAGTGPLSQIEVAQALSAGLGRPVCAQALPLDRREAGARAAGLGDYAVATLLAMFRYYASHGLTGNPNVLGWLLGRPPATLADFISRAAQEGSG